MPLAEEFWRLFDFKNPIESAVLQVLIEEGLPAYTRLTLPRIERPAPRVEIQFTLGRSTGHKKILTGNQLVPDAFEGQLSLQAVTAVGAHSDAHDSTTDEHGALCAKLHAVGAVFHPAINNLLDDHSLNSLIFSQETETMETDEGYEVTTLTWTAHVNIKTNAWPE